MSGKKTDDYSNQLRHEFGELIDSLDLKEQRSREYLRMRWLDQVMWMEKRAGEMRDRHRRLRLSVIICSAIVPIIVAMNFNQDKEVDKVLKVTVIAVSAVVTVSSAIDEFYQFGNRWYSYRKSAELLKTQGWQFFQLSGAYRNYETHEEALPIFSDEIEGIIQRDVEIYVSEGMQQLSAQEKTPELPPTDPTL
ncbi:DUF4231 domain-containing protein [Leptolyngbya sp. AN03gr2]|uniref:DUF4231 domain-containing protein n=1 Tax=unclassified Leptolyngbya TaxID=2650499 RepID=UPI003D3104B3